MTERITVLRDGKLVLTRAFADVTNADVVRAMAGRDVASAGAPQRAPSEDVVLDVSGLGSARVNDVSFKVRRGEIVGLAGLLGAGRSRTLHAIFGSEKRTHGTVRVGSGEGGVEVESVPDHGSTFRIVIPHIPAAVEEVAAVEASSA